jgi:hypothetical protein
MLDILRCLQTISWHFLEGDLIPGVDHSLIADRLATVEWLLNACEEFSLNLVLLSIP